MNKSFLPVNDKDLVNLDKVRFIRQYEKYYEFHFTEEEYIKSYDFDTEDEKNDWFFEFMLPHFDTAYEIDENYEEDDDEEVLY